MYTECVDIYPAKETKNKRNVTEKMMIMMKLQFWDFISYIKYFIVFGIDWLLKVYRNVCFAFWERKKIEFLAAMHK